MTHFFKFGFLYTAILLNTADSDDDFTHNVTFVTNSAKHLLWDRSQIVILSEYLIEYNKQNLA